MVSMIHPHLDPDCYKKLLIKNDSTSKCRNALTFDFASLTPLPHLILPLTFMSLFGIILIHFRVRASTFESMCFKHYNDPLNCLLALSTKTHYSLGQSTADHAPKA